MNGRVWLSHTAHCLALLSLGVVACADETDAIDSSTESAAESGSAGGASSASNRSPTPSTSGGSGGRAATTDAKPATGSAGARASTPRMTGQAGTAAQAAPSGGPRAGAGGAGGNTAVSAGAPGTGPQTGGPAGPGGAGGAAGSQPISGGAGAAGATDAGPGTGQAGETGAGGSRAEPMAGTDPAEPTDPDVITGGPRWLGRVDDREPGAVRFSWAGSGLAAIVDGPEIALRLRNENGSVWYQMIIDDEPADRIEVREGEHVIPLGSGLRDSRHRVEIYRDTEGDGAISVFLGFEKGSLVGAPRGSGRFFEIVGDSITVGFGNLGMEHHDISGPDCGGTHETSSWFLTYEAIAARELNAEVSTIARSGYGMYRGYGKNMSVMPPLFDDTLADEDEPLWSFQRQPEALIINLGTNDWNGGDPGTPYETAYIKFVTSVRERYPDAWLLLTIGPTLEDGRKRQVVARLDRVLAARKQAGDSKVDVIDIGIQGTAVTGCGWHPSSAEHMRMGMLLADELRTRLGWN